MITRQIAFSLIVAASVVIVANAQETRPPIKLTPDQVKLLQEQQKQFENNLKKPDDKAKTYSAMQCRADTQRWTVDPFDNSDERNLSINTAVMVNGQMRSMPPITAHVTFPQLLERIHEMSICEEVDSDFQKQFNTYAMIGNLYGEEESFRYFKFLMDHSLYHQFITEDAAANK